MEHSTKEKLTIKGTFWSAGDNVYVDVRNSSDQKWESVCLNDLMKKHITENSVVEIEVTLYRSER